MDTTPSRDGTPIPCRRRGDGAVPAEGFASVTARERVVSGGPGAAPMRRMPHAPAAALPRARHRTLTGRTREPARAVAPVLADFFARDVCAHRAS
ncbi:hypothetical protein [Streptomyces sp. NPDC057418]|uniref:hypothetical protein n=1 Tax=Streptomyces sp. NPDC057418 TaxID=3346126 RepID=UPI0036CA09BF